MNTMNGTNELVFALQQKLTGTSAMEPYCVLSRELLLRVIAALRERSVEPVDGWLAAIERLTTATEFRIYRALYQARGQTVTHDVLMKSTGSATVTFDSLWVHTHRLRVKMEKYGWGRMETVRKTGYYLVLPEQEILD